MACLTGKSKIRNRGRRVLTVDLPDLRPVGDEPEPLELPDWRSTRIVDFPGPRLVVDAPEWLGSLNRRLAKVVQAREAAKALAR